jgi:hypothetical protein
MIFQNGIIVHRCSQVVEFVAVVVVVVVVKEIIRKPKQIY